MALDNFLFLIFVNCIFLCLFLGKIIKWVPISLFPCFEKSIYPVIKPEFEIFSKINNREIGHCIEDKQMQVNYIYINLYGENSEKVKHNF